MDAIRFYDASTINQICDSHNDPTQPDALYIPRITRQTSETLQEIKEMKNQKIKADRIQERNRRSIERRAIISSEDSDVERTIQEFDQTFEEMSESTLSLLF